MTPLDPQQAAARAWFEALRDRICAAFEAIEREAGSDAAFAFTPWTRDDPTGAPGGGGVRGVMKGRVFEKVGVNVSTVGGQFSPEFARSIHGAAEDPRFFATGISLVAHMANPHVPAVHMNTRYLRTTRSWFGGGADLNPPLPYDEDNADFHARLRAACDAHAPVGDYPRFARWAEEYFFIPHRGVPRGAGGIFYDHLDADGAAFAPAFAFTQAVGEAFLDIYPLLVRRRRDTRFTAEEETQMLAWRGRYAEFNLVHDRGTLFGLKTGGNVDAILMSLPPRAIWP
ncbi:oxygen-dependent coproporphyrinogen oxidase [Sphingomonas morindae]|uniref:coproporphyrinogen oxidase n=1 Tax=Sphingomonas morindae TaxID=1541170 RepID=A0ABY4X5R2_9SPHN|nr:oxygen-dependent coproporphyrinogen oxidase [Sphingomonas morindae]USI72253.1 oxygen-dependent coproporphyrinogen oxidase [Sphingomonas morindae]